MCLSVPAKVLSISGDMATVAIGGVKYEASLQLVDNVSAGDYVLLHTGFVIQKISDEEAGETFKLLRELGSIDRKIRPDEYNAP